MTRGGLECVGQAETNACGGCDALQEQPGRNCGDENEGMIGCVGPDEVRCVVPGENACGGDEPLDGQPGMSCGPCDGGVVACETDNETTCVDEQRGVNDCGGCSDLPGIHGRSCGACDGELVCSGENDLSCKGGIDNVCGGCASLPEQPGEPCGEDEDNPTGYVACQAMDSVYCADPSVNACGGNTILEGVPGRPCGECGDGTYVCSGPDRLICYGASEPNTCGGCDRLVAEPLTDCGLCDRGEYICGSVDAVGCVGASTNACGGCEELDQEPGTRCGTEGMWQCAGGGRTGCMGDEAWFFDRLIGEVQFHSVGGLDPERAWAAGTAQRVFQFEGSAFGSEVVDDAEGVFASLWGNDDGELWIAAVEATSGEVWHFNGDSWESLDFEGQLFGLSGAGESDVWAVGNRGDDPPVLRYTDGDWTPVELSGLQEEIAAVWEVAVGSDGVVWALGGEHNDTHYVLRYDVDGWEIRQSTDDAHLRDVWYDEESGDVWIVGDQGFVQQYDAAEQSWTTHQPDIPGGPEHLTGVSGNDDGDVIAVGDGGVVLRYDGGEWMAGVVSSGERALRDVWVYGHVFWAVGEDDDDRGTVSRYGFDEFFGAQ